MPGPFKPAVGKASHAEMTRVSMAPPVYPNANCIRGNGASGKAEADWPAGLPSTASRVVSPAKNRWSASCLSPFASYIGANGTTTKAEADRSSGL